MAQENNNNPNGNFSNYLVTEAVNVKNIDDTKLSSDLDDLHKAEEKKQKKVDISKGIRNPQVKRAVSALKLTNPFKGY